MTKDENVWEVYDSLRIKIEEEHSELNTKCRKVLEFWYDLNNHLNKDFAESVNRTPKEFTNSTWFILTFYFRNYSYLISAYKLNREGLINPARSLTRTVYEQIMRSYLYLEYPEEAELQQKYLETRNPELKAQIQNQPRQWWSHKYMIGKLYEGEQKKDHRNFYEVISWFSHPTQRAIWADFGKIDDVEDNFRGILGFSYDSVSVMQKTLEKIMSDKTIELCNDLKEEVKKILGDIPKMEPNKNFTPPPQKTEE